MQWQNLALMCNFPYGSISPLKIPILAICIVCENFHANLCRLSLFWNFLWNKYLYKIQIKIVQNGLYRNINKEEYCSKAERSYSYGTEFFVEKDIVCGMHNIFSVRLCIYQLCCSMSCWVSSSMTRVSSNSFSSIKPTLTGTSIRKRRRLFFVY